MSDSDTIIRKAGVIGAGSMGSGIAAQFADAGIPVVLLDVASDGPVRDAIARGGVERQLGGDGFKYPDRAALVTTGTVEHDLDLLADADWIVEAVIEDAEKKRALFRRVEAVRRDGSAVSSNTSTIPLATLTAGLGDRFAQNFAITHFFNPPRRMALVEVVAGAATQADLADMLREAVSRDLGKTVVECRDTPGFIANRIGCFWMAMASLAASELGLTIEEADAVASAPFGVPRTGIFGLFDLVGIDIVPNVWGSLLAALPAGDPHHAYDITQSALFTDMIAAGRLGRKAKAGFYRLVGSGPERKREVIDLSSGAYRPEIPAALDSLATARGALRRLCEAPDRGGHYAWRVLSETVLYAAAVAPEIADDPGSIDIAMRLGYAWQEGPFALAERVGISWIAGRLETEGREIPPLMRQARLAGSFLRAVT